MCLFGGSSTSTSESKTKTDPAIEAGKKVALQRAMDIVNQTYPGYDPSKRYAGFTGDQNTAFSGIRNYLTNDAPNGAFDTAKGAAQMYGSAPAQNLTTERVIDENGRLGAISEYMNPYIQQAMQPAIAEMMRQGGLQRKDISSGATMAGAFGDARHGVVEGRQYDNEQRAIGDFVGQGMASAYGDAMGRREGDRNMMGSVDQANANYAETFLNRVLQGGEAGMTFEQGQDTTQLNRLLALLQSGGQQQAQAQLGKDAEYEEFLTAREWPFRGLDALISFMSGTPNAQTVTTKQQTPNSGAGGLIGGVLGSLL